MQCRLEFCRQSSCMSWIMVIQKLQTALIVMKNYWSTMMLITKLRWLTQWSIKYLYTYIVSLQGIQPSYLIDINPLMTDDAFWCRLTLATLSVGVICFEDRFCASNKGVWRSALWSEGPDKWMLANEWVWPRSWTQRECVNKALTQVSSASSKHKWKCGPRKVSIV